MKNYQYDALCGGKTKTKRGFTIKGGVAHEEWHAINKIRLIVTEGKHKGKYLTFAYGNASKVHGYLDGVSETVAIKYASVEFIDQYGKPDIRPVIDMTGREITEGCWVAYSDNTRTGSHSLVLGKVLEITSIGTMTVEAIIKDGAKLPPDKWRHNRSLLTNTFRVLRLPVEATDMMMWMMQDFEETPRLTSQTP